MSPPARSTSLAILIPAYDEAESVEPLHEELTAMIEREGLDAEIVWIDDGSRDGTWEALERITARDERSRAVRLRRNFGKTAALVAGLEHARGDIVCMLDADGQDDPGELPRLLDKLDEGYDLVSGWKQKRKDPLRRVLASRVFNAITSAASGLRLHDHNCGIKVVRRAVFDEVRLFGNLHRFLTVLAKSRGFRVAERPVAHRRREHGKSKYGTARYVTGLLDLLLVRFLTDYRGRPQHLLGTAGLVALLAGGAALAWLALTWVSQFVWPEGYLPLAERPLTFYALGALIVGAQLLSLGVLAALVHASSSGDREQFSVREVRGRALERPTLRTVERR